PSRGSTRRVTRGTSGGSSVAALSVTRVADVFAAATWRGGGAAPTKTVDTRRASVLHPGWADPDRRGHRARGGDRRLGLVGAGRVHRVPDRGRHLRPRAEEALHTAQLPGARARALPTGGDPPGAAAVLHRAQLRRPPV